jgi:hypothetical protein
VPPPPPIRKTCKRYNVPGHAHFLTFSCFRRRPFLARDRSRGWMIDAIALARERHGLHLWAWVIMSGRRSTTWRVASPRVPWPRATPA